MWKDDFFISFTKYDLKFMVSFILNPSLNISLVISSIKSISVHVVEPKDILHPYLDSQLYSRIQYVFF